MQHHYEGHWKGWALKNETFSGPEMAASEESAIKYKRHINNRYIGNFVVCCSVLLCVAHWSMMVRKFLNS